MAKLKCVYGCKNYQAGYSEIPCSFRKGPICGLSKRKCTEVQYELKLVARVAKNGEFKAIKKAKKHYSNIQIHNIMKAYVAQRKKKKKIKTGSCDYRDCLYEMSSQGACAYCENGSHWASKIKEIKK